MMSSTMTPSTSTTNDATSLNTDSAEGGSSTTDAMASTTGSGGDNDVILGGRAQDFLGNLPIPGVNVSLYSDGSVNDVTDDDGNFELGPLAPDMPVSIVLDAINVNNIDYFAAVIPERTGMMDRTDVIATMLNQDVIDAQIDGLASQMPATPDLGQAIVVVILNIYDDDDPADILADGTIGVTMDPAPADDTYYAANMMGQQQLNSSDIGWETIPAAVFYNLPEYEPGDITVTVEHADTSLWTCAVLHPEWPTIGGHTTFVLFECDPA